MSNTINSESIFGSIKKLIGFDMNVTSPFDTDLLIYINSTFSILTQLGVGPSEGFLITGNNETWTDFLDDDPRLEFVKTYTYMKVKQMFDPPINSAASTAMEKLLSELEWRINAEVNPYIKN